MHPRAKELIDRLGLQPHPEGGHYRETHRSAVVVQPGGGGGARRAVTAIYFLLADGEHSRWHRVAGADETWHHYEGDPLELLCVRQDGTLERHVLGAVANGRAPQATVPAGCWQAARLLGAYAFVGCTVGPGFEFADFAMLAHLPDEEANFRAQYPDLAALI